MVFSAIRELVDIVKKTLELGRIARIEDDGDNAYVYWLGFKSQKRGVSTWYQSFGLQDVDFHYRLPKLRPLIDAYACGLGRIARIKDDGDNAYVYWLGFKEATRLAIQLLDDGGGRDAWIALLNVDLVADCGGYNGLPFEARMGSSPNYNQTPSNSFEWRKTIFEMVASMGICHTKPCTLRGGPLTKLEQSMTSEREITPPPGFSAVPITTTMFAATTPENTSMAYRASTLANPNLGERTVGFKGAQNRGESRVERNTEGGRPLEATPRGNGGQSVNLPPLLEAYLGRDENGKPLQYSLTSAYGDQALSNNIGGNLPSNGAILNPVGLVTPFVRWIEDYRLPNGLKMPSHIGSYDGKGDPDNFPYLFKGAIWMQKWLMPISRQNSNRILAKRKKFTKMHLAIHNIKQREGESTRAFITRYTDDTLQILVFHEEQRISGFVHGLRTRSLVEHLSMDLPSTYKGLMEKTYTWVKDRGRFSPYKGQNHKLLYNLVKSPREILATEKAAKTFEQPPWLPGANWSKDKMRYCHFHEDYGHGTNQCRELKHQIGEAVKYGQLAHLVKGVKEKKEKTIGSSDPIIIKVYISGRQANKAYLDRGSSCEIIYEHCFLKLKPSIRSLRVDSNTLFVSFSAEQSWPWGEIPLEVTIGEGPIAVTKTLTFVIVKSDSPHNLLLGRTVMKQIGIVVSTVHRAIKFHTPRGIGTIFSKYDSHKPKEEEDGPTNKYQGNEKNILSCIDTEKRMVINNKYPEQKITIGRQLPTRIKIRLRDLLKRYVDVFTWTSAHIMGVPRVLMIEGETFNTEHRINVFNHAKPVKQKKKSLAPERNKAILSHVEELIEVGIL
ncbi:reverse transcriptase domain-containing protein [Tanacetum coccineum]